MNLCCPICRESFISINGTTLVCKNGHSYDKSRDGYYNLLPPRRASVHGDNKEMIQARRAFLDTGAYLPLARRIGALACESAVGDKVRLLDIGCGEGYYTRIVRDALTERGVQVSLCAFDISKDAVRSCARRVGTGEFAVASAYHVPVQDGRFNIALNIFSPLAIEETHRVLAKDGVFIMAIPAAEHLFELKRAVYDTPYKNEVQDTHLDGFELLSREELEYDIHLDTKEKIASLFKMTPYAYRTRREDAEKLYALDTLTVKASFILLVYKRKLWT